MDPVLFFGAATGLVAGSLGYVLYFSAARPVVRYRRTKAHIARLLPAKGSPGNGPEDRRRILQAAERLEACARKELPQWYLQVLVRREENPAEAVACLQKLATARDAASARRQADRARRLLQLPDARG